jgi:hypothetical protein
MKASSLLVLFCLLNVILCYTIGITDKELKASFKDSLNFIKAFHKKTYSLGKGVLTGVTLTNPILTENNVDFKVETEHVRVIFQNIKLTLSGGAKVKKSTFNEYTKISAVLENFKYEVKFSVSSKKLETGKYEVKFSKTSESTPTFKIAKITSKFTGLTEIEEQLKNNEKSLDFTPYKAYLNKIASLVIETLPSHMK